MKRPSARGIGITRSCDLEQATVEFVAEDRSVGWYLFGAQAAIVYGAARLTADVDVTVRLPDAMSSQSLAVRVADRGFRLRNSNSAFIERTRVIPFVDHMLRHMSNPRGMQGQLKNGFKYKGR